jgi:hypothetical protein
MAVGAPLAGFGAASKATRPPALATPLNLPPPKDAQQAKSQIAQVTSLIAQGQIDADIGRSIVIGLQASVGCIAAELEAEVEEREAFCRILQKRHAASPR